MRKVYSIVVREICPFVRVIVGKWLDGFARNTGWRLRLWHTLEQRVVVNLWLYS